MMRMKKISACVHRCLSILLVMAVLLTLEFVPVNTDRNIAFAAEDITDKIVGKWSGTYAAEENDGKTYDRNIVITIYDYSNSNGKFSGVFEYSIPNFRGGLYGSYLFHGTLDISDYSYSFTGVEMIVDDGYYSHSSYSTYTGVFDFGKGEMAGSIGTNEYVFKKGVSNVVTPENVKGVYAGTHYGGINGINVMRSSTISIEQCSQTGNIEGRFIIYPIEGANNQINAVYHFKGFVDLSKNTIFFIGDKWIEYPDVDGDYTFQIYNGTIDIDKGVLQGNTENGEFHYLEVAEKKEIGFSLGVDNNNFVHTNSATWDGAGFVGMNNYSIDDEYFDRLTAHSSKTEKNRIKKAMNDSWGGSCYGIAMSIGLLYENYITINDLTESNSVSNYHSLAYPCNDDKFRNMINYYQLSQSLENGGKSTSAISAAYNTSMFKRLKNWLCGDDELSEFLRKLVEYSSQDHVKLMGFSTSEGGHAVLVVGCEYDEDSGQYVVKIYDENSVNSSKSPGEFSYMRIDSDFSSFVYTDSNGDKITNSSYRTIYFLNWNSLGNIVPSAPVQSSHHAKINFLLENDFKIVDDSGRYLEYDGTEFTGDMNIYDIDTIEADDGTHIIMETDNFSTVKVTDIENKLDIDVYNDDDYQSLSASNIDSAEMILGEKIKLEGQNYSFKAYMSTDDISENESGLISVAADAKTGVSIDKDGDVIKVTSSDEMTNIVSENLEGSNVTITNQGNSNEVTVTTDNSSGVKVSNITLSSDKTTVTLDETISINATINPDDATNKNIVWSSSDESVAKVDQNGKVTGIKAGSVTISATAADESGAVGTLIISVVHKTDSSSATDGTVNNSQNGNRNNSQTNSQNNTNSNDGSSSNTSTTIKLKKVSFKNTNKVFKYKTLKKKKQSYSVIKSNGVGKATVAYMNKGKISKKICKKYISVSKNGKITVKKGAKKGTYKIKVTVAKNSKYQKTSKVVYIKVK